MCDLSEQSKQHYLNGTEDFRHAYGSTLIAAAVCEKYRFGIHIGDGRFTILDKDGAFSQPVPWDDRCFLNVTTSICDDDASDRARKVLSSLYPKVDNKKNNVPTVSFVNADIPVGDISLQ